MIENEMNRRTALRLGAGGAAASAVAPLLGASGAAAETGSQAQTPGSQPVIVKFGERATTALPRLGFNTENTTNPFGWDEPNGEEATKGLTPAFTRFPGGAISNWYDWRNDTCYDVPSEVQNGQPARWRERIATFRGGHLGFDDWYSLTRESGAEPVIVNNLYFPFDWTPDQLAEDAAEWVRYVNVERGLGVKYWELGNEFYLQAYVDRYNDPSDPSGRTRDPAAYVDVAARATAAMKAVDPSIEVIVVGGHANLDEWNQVIAQADFYDQVAIHIYTQSTDSRHFNLPPGEPGAGTGDYEAEARWLLSRTAHAPSELNDYARETFGNDVRVFATEWGLHRPTSRSLTTLGALFDADFILHAADHAENFPALFHHTLTIPAFGYGKYHYNREEGAGSEPESFDSEITKAISYYVHAPLNEAINGATSAVSVSAQHMPTFEGRFRYEGVQIDGVTIRAWEMPNGDLKVAAVNKMNHDQDLVLSGQLPSGDASHYVLTGPLDAMNSGDEVFNPGVLPDTVVPESVEISGRRVTLPAYSFSMVTMEA